MGRSAQAEGERGSEDRDESGAKGALTERAIR